MRIVLNGRPCDLRAGRLDRVLEELGYQDAKVATAVNGSFVARGARGTTELREGDALEVIAPMQGG